MKGYDILIKVNNYIVLVSHFSIEAIVCCYIIYWMINLSNMFVWHGEGE